MKSSASALRSSLQRPLLRLQSGIRRYVILESFALLIVAVFIWALVSLCFDWGVLFQLFGFDYLREGTSGIQWILRVAAIGILVGLTIWILGRYLVVRLFRPITSSDLAMAIERRFGEKLGDRLVTAVELHDWEQARRQGYSSGMIEATTAEAERELGAIDVANVLNTRRLRKRLMLAASCLLIALAAILFLPEVAITWFERTMLWQPVPWPRSTILEFADFHEHSKAVPFGSELKVTVRSAKWAVADRSVSEGWRPLMAKDFAGKTPVAWELDGFTDINDFLAVLPAAWQNWSCDQIENQLSDSNPGIYRELGLALIRNLQNYFWEHRQSNAALPANLASFLPEKLRQLSIDQQKVALAAAAGLSSADAERILKGLTMLRPVPGDAAFSLGHLSMFPLPSPMPSMSLFQKIAYDRDRDCAPFAMPESEKMLLPAYWQKMPVRDLAKRLRSYAAEESAESLGKLVALQGQALFKVLEDRAAQTRFGSRKTFRQLQVPDKVILEFENVVETEDRSRGRAKRGQPELKRTALSNEFTYEFKKMERAMRLRAGVKSIVTPWYRVDVKPLPTLKRLERWHDEPAYLHSSSARVRVGPLVLALDGDETRATAPAGSSVWFEGESHRPLKNVRIVTENADPPSVDLSADGIKFNIKPKSILREDLRFTLEFEDQDGIVAKRTILLMLTPDKPPEFIKAQFEAVNRKYITAKALLPISVAVHDDVGLLSLQYEVSIQKNDHSVIHEARLPFRSYFPLRVHEAQAGGFRFENPEDMILPRVYAQMYADSTNDPFYLLGTSARLPSGWMSAIPPVHVSLRRDYRHEYVDRQLYGPVLSTSDEFLDTLDLRSVLNKPITEPVLETPYRMVVRLVARDNRMREDVTPSVAQHQEGKTSESFEFNVVSEQDVLIEASKREEDLRDRFEENIAALRSVRSNLKRVRDELDISTQPPEDIVRRCMNDTQDATKALAQIRGGLDEKVLREFRQIYRELALNRVDERILDRLDRRICNPLAILLQPEQSFAKLESGVDLLARRLESEGASIPKNLLSEPVTQADRVLQKLEEILNDMRKLIEFNEALRILRDLINNEQKLLEEMKKLIQQKLKNDLDDK